MDAPVNEFDISGLNEAQLVDLINKAHERIATLQNERLEQAQDKVIELSRSVGMTPEEVIMEMHKARRTKRSGTFSTPVYANPENPDQTWSGRGNRPRWLKQKLSDGAVLKDFIL